MTEMRIRPQHSAACATDDRLHRASTPEALADLGLMAAPAVIREGDGAPLRRRRSDDPVVGAGVTGLVSLHRQRATVIRRDETSLPKPLPQIPGSKPLAQNPGAEPLPQAMGPKQLLTTPDSADGTTVDSDADVDAVIGSIARSGLLTNSAFINKSPQEIQAGFDLWFGVRKGNAADVDVTKKRQMAGEVYAGGGAAVTGRAAYGSAEHELPFGLTVTQYDALAQASAIIGVQGVAKGQLRAKLGTKAYTGLKGAISGFAGAKATAQGSGKLVMVQGIPFPVGAKLAGSVAAFAGAQSDGNLEFTLAMNPAEWAGIGLDIGADYDAKAGAWADASGDFTFDPLGEGISLSGTASAFAGVSGEVGVSGSAKLYGRKAFTVSTSVSGSAGVGGSASGGFSLKGGTLVLKGKAEGAMGPGLGGGFGLGMDFKPIAVLINREIAKASWKALATTDRGVGKKATDPDLARRSLDADVRPRLVKYRDWKLHQLEANLAAEYAKMENIQMIIDENWPRTLIRVKNDEIDNHIIAMVKEVFGVEYPDSQSSSGAMKTVDVDVRVTKGQLKVLQFVPRDIASILAGTVAGKHGKGENANAAYSPHGLAQS